MAGTCYLSNESVDLINERRFLPSGGLADISKDSGPWNKVKVSAYKMLTFLHPARKPREDQLT